MIALIVRAFMVMYQYYTINIRYKNLTQSALFFLYTSPPPLRQSQKFNEKPRNAKYPEFCIKKCNVRLQFMTHHQFMAKFCDCPIKEV